MSTQIDEEEDDVKMPPGWSRSELGGVQYRQAKNGEPVRLTVKEMVDKLIKKNIAVSTWKDTVENVEFLRISQAMCERYSIIENLEEYGKQA